MSGFDIPPILADRSRLRIMAALATSDEPLDFSTLLASLELTRGNLSVHLRKLEESGYLVARKEFRNRIPRTSYECTGEGRKAIRGYLKSVERLLKEI